MAEKKGDVKKRKSKDERASLLVKGFISMGEEVMEKKKRGAKRRPCVEKKCDVQDEMVSEKKKGTHKTWQLKIKDGRSVSVTMVKKKQRVPEDNKGADNQGVARNKIDWGLKPNK